MKLLIIGGTLFVGRALTEMGLARGHEITLFNRGQGNPELFPEVEKVKGDRDGGLGALGDREWDAVIDTCGYFPRVVRQSAEALSGRVGLYCFISSISVYADFSSPWDENGPLASMDPQLAEKTDDIDNSNYGPMKVMCEQIVEQHHPGRTLIVRPGIIAGPHDPSDRLTYWLVRGAKGGDMIVPGQPEADMQIIDVRDLAEWTISRIEKGTAGIYNTTGPDYRLTMGDLLKACNEAAGGNANPIYPPDSVFEHFGVNPIKVNCWWTPEGSEEYRHRRGIDSRKAQADGLNYRPLRETIRDTIAWDETRSEDYEWKAGLSADDETRILDYLKSQA